MQKFYSVNNGILFDAQDNKATFATKAELPEAIARLDSLDNCHNTLNCTDCIDCVDCDWCENCQECNQCVDCVDCVGGVNLSGSIALVNKNNRKDNHFGTMYQDWHYLEGKEHRFNQALTDARTALFEAGCSILPTPEY